MKVYGAGYDTWEIRIGDKIVGTIRTFDGFRKKIKSVYVGETDKQICDIRNQTEAVEKLQSFFEQNKRDIAKHERWYEELGMGISQVQHQICIDTLSLERSAIAKKLEKLRELDLI
ncbi:hypothetical protein [Bacillus mycoides]|uniref:hypothetical protein n=1 Tax=Bacillus mycoides TaxID=1405 RepID=UPI000BF66093|nr:hypothetical protein [Bacillus mycoides]PGA05666.1 hypothetical protein COL71_26075 [Bacillus mycoides]